MDYINYFKEKVITSVMEEEFISLVAYDMKNRITYIGKRSNIPCSESKVAVEKVIRIPTECLTEDYEKRVREEYDQKGAKGEKFIRLKLKNLVTEHNYHFIIRR